MRGTHFLGLLQVNITAGGAKFLKALFFLIRACLWSLLDCYVPRVHVRINCVAIVRHILLLFDSIPFSSNPFLKIRRVRGGFMASHMRALVFNLLVCCGVCCCAI